MVVVPEADPGVLWTPLPPVPDGRVGITADGTLNDGDPLSTVELVTCLSYHLLLGHYQPGGVVGGAEQELENRRLMDTADIRYKRFGPKLSN